MNKKQVRVIWIGIVLFLLTIPLEIALQIHLYGSIATFNWLNLFLGEPTPAKVIAVITIGLFVTFRDKKDDNPKDEQNNKQGNR